MRIFLSGALLLLVSSVASAQSDVKELISKLEGKDSDEQRAAAKALAEMGTDAKSAIKPLTKSLNNKDMFVRRFSAEALGNIGPDAKSAISDLTRLMRDERKEVQVAAVEAIGKMGPSGIDALISAVRDPNNEPDVRRKGAQGLGKLGAPARKAVPVFTDILTGKISSPKAKGKGNKGDDDILVAVATALGTTAKAEDKDAIAALKRYVEGKQKNKALMQAAAKSIKQITNEEVKIKKKK